MRVNVYKGFTKDFLEKLTEKPLVESSLDAKIYVPGFDKKYRKNIDIAVLSLETTDVRWMTYEEYAFAHDRIDLTVDEDGLEVYVYRNNLLPDYYPLAYEMENGLLNEVLRQLNEDSVRTAGEECKLLLSVYSDIVTVGEKLYYSFYNYEYEKTGKIQCLDYYPASLHMPITKKKGDIDIQINDDIPSYLRSYEELEDRHPARVTVRRTNSELSKRIELTLIAYCQKKGIEINSYHEPIGENNPRLAELNEIAKNVIKIPNFEAFREIKFYRDPDISNEVMDVSQAQIITDIIEQAEKAYDDKTGNNYRDIFITAFTGAGKSVMFQVPAVYLARKYGKLTIIIEPVKSLMQDQKDQLNERGYNRVEVFNSDLITQAEKEKVLRKVKEGEVDLLYLSPETLLSYSMDTIVGDREIGLIIVDEAHIVTTWGFGFRPDYWYLGGYLNTVRHGVQTQKSKDRRIQNFPICAFTATAVNTGIDDSVSETIISLYMENPIKYIGYIKRDDIQFQIMLHNNQKMTNEAYEEAKGKTFAGRIEQWLTAGAKTVVYFPYATYAWNAYRGFKNFSSIRRTGNPRIGIYTGRNVDENQSLEEQSTRKKETFDKFRSGEISIMYATKAFGMGVDINDIENVYHYAATGNLSDYVQEIGRAARKKGLIGKAITDYYYNDISFMQRLFGMSQIRQYQVQKVLAGIYDVYRAKGGSRNFLISPDAFSYIFVGKKKAENQDEYINQLKTCLMMLEKDLYDKFNFKVMITRPRSVFTKAYVVIEEKYINTVLKSKYAECFKFVEPGRKKEPDSKGDTLITDYGDVYQIDLKMIWETHYQNISFPWFKYLYFNKDVKTNDKTEIMPEIREYIFARQKVSIEVKNDLLLSDLRSKILDDFEYITDVLYSQFKKTYFKLDDFARAISKRFGSMTKARVIANNLFELVDPKNQCVKRRNNSEDIGGAVYLISNGTFKEYLKKPIIKSELFRRFDDLPNDKFSKYMPVITESKDFKDPNKDMIALKLLSIFDYITYEIQGGENPEIFIRLNDPAKVRRIVMGELKYSNSYVTRAKQKHERDVKVLRRFFTELKSDQERWDYIERYFLGQDVLEEKEIVISQVKMEAAIDKHKSTLNVEFHSWKDIATLMEDSLLESIREMEKKDIPIPTYMSTEFKKESFDGAVLMSWPEKNVLIFDEEISPGDKRLCDARGWLAMDLSNIDMEKLEKRLK